MSWLGWLVAAFVLCPLWLKVADETDKLRRRGGHQLGGLPRALYFAAVFTAIIIALMAVAALIQWSGAQPNFEHGAQP